MSRSTFLGGGGWFIGLGPRIGCIVVFQIKGYGFMLDRRGWFIGLSRSKNWLSCGVSNRYVLHIWVPKTNFAGKKKNYVGAKNWRPHKNYLDGNEFCIMYVDSGTPPLSRD
jgi:hypothetical protein